MEPAQLMQTADQATAEIRSVVLIAMVVVLPVLNVLLAMNAAPAIIIV